MPDGRDGRDGRDGADGLQGLRGLPGRDGIDGKAGKDGRDGLDGKDGEHGAKGADGKAGRDGANGADGKAGLPGAPGAPGRHGKDGRLGPRGPAGPMGPMPQHEWEGTRIRFEQPDGEWGEFVDLRGERGQRGEGGGGAVPVMNFVQHEVAIEGATVAITNTSRDGTLVLEGDEAVSVLTISFPADKRSRIGQTIRLASLVEVFDLTLSGADITNPIFSVSAGDCVAFQKINPNSWIRVV